jgi:acetyl-CoA carboxylase biotin carboxyl carrier protein
MKMSHKSLELKEIKAILDWVNLTEDVREFSLRYDGIELFISRNQNAAAPASAVPAGQQLPVAASTTVAAPAIAAAPVAVAPTPVAGARPEPAADEIMIKAPMVGTFYATPKPGAAPFVNVGDTVGPQTVLCIVEVMKLMNNIEAGVDGTITRIFVDNEQPVEFGQPLMTIRRRG